MIHNIRGNDMKRILIIFVIFLFPFYLSAYRFQQRSVSEILQDIKKHPSDAKLYSELGDAYYKDKKLKKAEKAYKKAIKLDPKLSSPYAGLSSVYRKENKLEKALDYALIASQLNPFKARYLGNVGLIYYKMKDYKNAEEYFKKAIGLNPKKKGFFYNMLGFIYMKNGEYDKAIYAFQKVYDEKPWDKSIYVSMARAYYKKGDKEKGDYYKRLAGDEWDKFISKINNNKSSNPLSSEIKKGWEYYKNKDYKNALLIFKKYASKDYDAMKGLGLTYSRLKKYNLAVKYLRKVYNKTTNNKEKTYLKKSLAFNLYMLAKNYERKGNKKESVKLYKEVIKIAPESKWASYAKRQIK